MTISSATISPVIFNTEKTDYEKTPIILGQPRGLVDSITQQYPEQTGLYRKLRGSDWTEFEFVFEQCKVEFADPDLSYYSSKMRQALAYQWQTDSNAASTIAGITSCVVSSSEIFTGYQRISDNESIHALTYSEIVRQSFDDPMAALHEFKADMNSIERLRVVAKVFETAFISAHRWALHQARPDLYPLNDKERYQIFDDMFMYFIALLCMERGQFMPSFATTFAICDLNIFQPIGDAVQRIAQDEIEIHVPFGKLVIRDLLATDRGREAFKNNRHLIIELVNETIRSEDHWVDVAFGDGRELPGAPPDSLKKFSYFGGTDIASFLGVETEVNFPLVYENPLSYMNHRMNLGTTQASPQEAPPTSYMVNAVQRDDKGRKWELTL
jgi:ribonucleoside-diphosphate reductase beta chain